MKYLLLIFSLLLLTSCSINTPVTQQARVTVPEKESTNTTNKQNMETQIENTKQQDNCLLFDDFTNTPENRWGIVNDGVMGGKSLGNGDIQNNALVFSGTIVTQGGGFSSLRGSLESGILSKYNSVKLRAKSDGREYRITFRDRNNSRISHQAIIPFTTPGELEEISMSFDQLETTYFGRKIKADPFDKESAREIGVILSDGVDGEFKLEIDEVRFCK